MRDSGYKHTAKDLVNYGNGILTELTRNSWNDGVLLSLLEKLENQPETAKYFNDIFITIIEKKPESLEAVYASQCLHPALIKEDGLIQILKLTKVKNPYIRSQAAEIIPWIPFRTELRKSFLRKLLSDRSVTVRCSALEALGIMSDTAGLKKIQKLYQTRNNLIKIWTIIAINSMASVKARPFLIKVFNDSRNRELKFLSAFGLFVTGDYQKLEFLFESLFHGSILDFLWMNHMEDLHEKPVLRKKKTVHLLFAEKCRKNRHLISQCMDKENRNRLNKLLRNLRS